VVGERTRNRTTARSPAAGALTPPVADSVDEILRQWAVQRPDLDFSPVGVLTRIARLRNHFDASLQEVFDRFGLSAADFQVIITLRRSGKPYRLAQSRLMTQLSLTSGTVSVRLERLERAGIVERGPDPADRRGALVTLTDHGLTLFDRVTPEHLANEDRLLSALDHGQREQFVDLLRRLLLSLEPGTSQVGTTLGVRLESAPAARRRRTLVGLSDTPGLLVADVTDPDLAGDLRRGDLLVAVNGTALHSEVTLATALRDRPGVKLTLEVLRGNEPVTVKLRAAPDPDATH
jgi:DNA-binding MarR family transcriptional regulator